MQRQSLPDTLPLEGFLLELAVKLDARANTGGAVAVRPEIHLLGPCTISDIVLDVRAGRIAYAVLSESGFLGMGTSLHAIPWNALTLDTDAECFHVSIAAQRIK